MRARRTPTGEARRGFGRRVVARVALLAAGTGLVVGAPALLGLGQGTAGAATTFRATVGYPAAQTVTVTQGTNGALQDAFYADKGTVYWRQELASGAWTTWRPLTDTQFGSPPEDLAYYGGITAAPGSNGSTLELFTTAYPDNDDTYVYVTWETATPSTAKVAVWSTWVPLATTRYDYFYDEVAYAPGTNGNLQEIFSVDDTGTILEKVERPGGSWGAWKRVATGGKFANYDDEDALTYAPGTNGSSQELFSYTYTTGKIWVTWTSGGTWHTWVTFNPPATDTTFTHTYPFYPGMTYAPGSDGSLQEIFAVGYEHGYQAYVNWENPNGSWAGWHSMGAPAGDTDGFDYSRLTYVPGSSSSLQEIFGVGDSTGQVYVYWENPNGSWAGWHSMGSPTLYFDEDNPADYIDYYDVSYAPGSNGSVQELFGLAYTTSKTSYGTYVDWENPGGSWSGWVYWGTAATYS